MKLLNTIVKLDNAKSLTQGAGQASQEGTTRFQNR
jgi:hypothetical protein